MKKEEILKILEMYKSGALTDNQAAELFQDAMRPVKTASGMKDNSIDMSNIAEPIGTDFSFTGNYVHASSIARLELRRSEMNANRIDTSKLEQISLTDAALRDCSFHECTVECMLLEKSSLTTGDFKDCKWSHIYFKDNSRMSALNLLGCCITDLNLSANSIWSDTEAHGTHIANLELRNSAFQGSKLEAALISETLIFGSQLKDIRMRGMSLKRTAFEKTQLTGIQFTSSHHWRNQASGKSLGLDDVRLQNCKLTNIEFSDLGLRRTTIRNVTISDQILSGLELSDLTIDGNAEFFEAIERWKKRNS